MVNFWDPRLIYQDIALISGVSFHIVDFVIKIGCATIPTGLQLLEPGLIGFPSDDNLIELFKAEIYRISLIV